MSISLKGEEKVFIMDVTEEWIQLRGLVKKRNGIKCSLLIW
jgi:hypothetical protein